MLKAHLDYVEETRRRFNERTAWVRQHPEEVLYINIDGMDQLKTAIPRLPSWSKADDVGVRLTTKLLGAIVYGRGYWGFWSIPEWGATSNLTLTALCKVLRDVSGRSPNDSELPRSSPSLPPRLFVQMDNTAKDNKNHYLLGFCAMLINESIFQDVEVHFLPVGHTHSDIDQTFSLINSRLSQEGAFSLPHLLRLASRGWSMHSSIGSPRKVHERLDHALDFRRLLRYDGESSVSTDPSDDDAETVSRLHRFLGLGTNRDTKRQVFMPFLWGRLTTQLLCHRQSKPLDSTQLVACHHCLFLCFLQIFTLHSCVRSH